MHSRWESSRTLNEGQYLAVEIQTPYWPHSGTASSMDFEVGPRECAVERRSEESRGCGEAHQHNGCAATPRRQNEPLR